MRWLLIFLCAPAAAGDFSLMAETWARDRERGLALEYTLDGEWKPSLMVARYTNDFDDPSWYGGIGLSRSLGLLGEWDLSASVYALYFKHSGEETVFLPGSGEPYTQGGDVIVPADTTVTYYYARSEYVAPSPALTLSYRQVGLTASTIQMPDRSWSTSLGIRFTF